MRHVLILGNGGHSLCIQEALLTCGYQREELGIVDPDDEMSLLGIQRIGQDDDLLDLASKGWNKAVIGVGSVTNTKLRHRLKKKIANAGIDLISLIDPEAKVSSTTKIGEGVYIAKGALIQPGVEISEMVIINTGAVIEHNCIIGAFSHVSSGTVLLGDVQIGEDTLIGAGSVIRQGIRIGKQCVIGAGSVVVRDIPDGKIAYGNPCRIRGETNDTDYC